MKSLHCLSRSSNNLSSNLHSTSPAFDSKDQFRVPNSPPSYSPAAANDGIIIDKASAKQYSNKKSTERGSLSDNVSGPENFTQSSAKHELTK